MNNDILPSKKMFSSSENMADRQTPPSQSESHIDSETKPDTIGLQHWEFLLGELVGLIGLFVSQSVNGNGVRTAEVLFDQLVRHLEILKRMPGHDGVILIRRIHCKVPTPPLDKEYFSTLGDLMVRVKEDSTPTNDQSKKQSAHLKSSIDQAFKCFSAQGIHSLSIKIPGDSPHEIDQLRLALNIVARFKTAVDDASSIRFRCYGRALTFSVIHDANANPDPNLTLTAALNGLSPVNARELIKQAEAFYTMQLSETEKGKPQKYVSNYNQIFSVRSLRSQIVKPPVEVNNLPWLEVDSLADIDPIGQGNPVTEGKPDRSKPAGSSKRQEKETPIEYQKPEEKADAPEQLRQLIAKYIDIDDEKHAEAMDALSADDYGELKSVTIGERFISLTQLLYVLDKQCHDPSIIERIIEFYRHRLKKINNTVLSNILTQRQGLKIISEGRTVIVGLVHPRLFDLITMLSEHVAARRRMAIIKNIAFNFDFSHMADLAAGFGLSEKEAHHILGILKDCFSIRGSFIRPTFEGRIDLMAEFGNAIFEILWCFLKETPRRQDRLDFLNALQLLMAKLKNPKRATQFLLADVCQNPADVGFTDRNAFSLANILLHQENKELYVDINRTPESVLTYRRRINKEVRQYVVWRLDADKVRMLAKLRGIHRTLEETLVIPPGEPRSFDLSFLMALEREAMIFMAIVGGMTSRTYLRELVSRYGSPESDIFKNASTKIHLPEIMAQLQIVVRSLGRAGNSEDVESLKILQENGKALYQLDTHPAHKLKVKQLMNIIPQTIKMMR
jgi:hypothetical protein